MRLEKVVVRDFRALEEAVLSDLPSEGLIAVLGGNESGKTSLAEAIGFALYGRSVREGASAGEFIRWGSDRLEVEVEFRAGAGRYRLRRELDRLGAHMATLRELEPGAETCAGVDAVARKLRSLGTPEFDVFRSLFYLHGPLGEEELRVRLLEEVTGISALAKAAEEVQAEIRGSEREFSLLVAEVGRKEQQAERLRAACADLPGLETQAERVREEFEAAGEESGSAHRLWRGRRRFADWWGRQAKRLAELEPRDIPALRSAVEKTEELLARERSEAVFPADDGPLAAVAERAACLRAFLEAYDGAVRGVEERRSTQQARIEEQRGLAASAGNGIERQRRRRRGAALFTFAAAVAACGAGAALYLLTDGRQSGSVLSPPLIAALAAGVTALVCAIVSFFSFLARSYQVEGLRRELRAASGIVEELEASAAELSQVLEDAGDPGKWASARERLGGGAGLAFEDVGDRCAALAEEVKKLAQHRRGRAGEADGAYRAAQEALRKARSNRDRAEGELKEKRHAAGRLSELDEGIVRLRNDLRGKEARLEVHLLALELLQSTISHIRLRAVPALNEALRRVIWPITGGRYREARFTQDLRAEVFASEKGDFLSHSELSGSMRAGIDLSAAVALAALRARTGASQGHFVLVDYPLAELEAERVRRVLSGLRSLPWLPQVLLFLQESPGEEPFARRWRLSGGRAHVEQAGDGRPPAAASPWTTEGLSTP